MPAPTDAVSAPVLRLADHDLDSLSSWLRERTGRALPSCRRAAAKALRGAFAPSADVAAHWRDATLQQLAVGRWARKPLLALSPALSLKLIGRHTSRDGSVRLLLQTVDAQRIETVLIPASCGRDRPRMTACLSSQVGCARACAFCETGTLGLIRQLEVAEIIDQFRIAAQLCSGAGADQPGDRRGQASASNATPAATLWGAAAVHISNVVFMGMGEPFDNLAHVLRAVSLLCTRQAFAVAPSRVTVSTSGVADKLHTFFASTRAELAISLNAPDDRRRDLLMPINRRFDLATLRRALVASLPAGRRVLLQYALFAGLNDSEADADQLADWVGALPCRVNVIAANPGPSEELHAPTHERVERFVQRLHRRGLTALLRASRGRDVYAACGQLAARPLAPSWQDAAP